MAKKQTDIDRIMKVFDGVKEAAEKKRLYESVTWALKRDGVLGFGPIPVKPRAKKPKSGPELPPAA